MTAGQATYDLRRLRTHGLIERIPHSNRYLPTNDGLRPRSCSPELTPDYSPPRSRPQPIRSRTSRTYTGRSTTSKPFWTTTPTAKDSPPENSKLKT